MSFHPGKKSNARKELRDMIQSPQVGSNDKRRAKDLLHHMSPTTNQFDGADDLHLEEQLDQSAVDALLLQAEQELMQLNSAGAKPIIDEALRLATDGIQRAQCLDLAVQIMMDEGSPQEEVIVLLKEAEILTPNVNFERVLTLAQFTSDFDSLKYYKQSIDIINKEIAELTNNGKTAPNKLKGDALDEYQSLVFTKSTAMVAIGELYTTDLCDEDDAEKQCEHWLGTAMKTDANNVEAVRSYGNLRVIQGNHKEAVMYTIKAFNLLKTLVQKGWEQYIPQFIPRLELCRQLYELQCWNETIGLACGLLQEEQMVGEIWLYALISSYRYAEGLNITLTQTADNKANAKKIANLKDEIQDLLTCAMQYAVRVESILKQSPDEEMSTQLQQYISLLETTGFSMKSAKKELIKLKQESQVQDHDQTILDTIESDSEDDAMAD